MSAAPLRNASFDYARLIAVIGIIWFHTHAPYGNIGYSGLSVFLMLLVFFAVPQIKHLRPARHRAPAFLRYATTRGQRLLVPWLVACALYGSLKLADVSRGAPWASEFDSTMWLTGTALHLWFLPFAFLICLMLWPLGRRIDHLKRPVRLHLCMLFMCLALIALAFWQTADLRAPVAQWAYALPSVCLGISFILSGGTVLRMAGVAALFFSMALSANWTTGLLEIGIASAVLITCQMIKLRPGPLSQTAARASLILYLVHPAVAALVARSHILPDHSTAMAVVVTLGSLAFVALWETIRATAPHPKGLFTQTFG